ncbi:MAG: hypothetical protein QG571_110, partial [Pseudomonadota bacterium]|nr:hypothetical protein [Pseudomonadota bacterium]
MFDDNGPLWLLVTLGFPVGIALVMVVRELRLLVRLRRPRTPPRPHPLFPVSPQTRPPSTCCGAVSLCSACTWRPP